MQEMFIFGAGGHAKVVADVIERQGFYRIAFLADDDPALAGGRAFGYDVIGSWPELLAAEVDLRRLKGSVGVGDNADRLKTAGLLQEMGFELVTAVHPSAQCGRGACIGDGTVVMAGAVLNPDAVIGNNVIINTAATVDHDCTIHDGAHIAPGCHLCGNVTVGAGSLVGAGAVVVPGVVIGKGVIVGAGSTVLRDVPDGLTVMGTPARPVPVRPGDGTGNVEA